ncbi:MAG: hypothetical protein IKY52_08770 [Clostridia bacterium]|nr:hypothetical protein [Clostridia bacterium]
MHTKKLLAMLLAALLLATSCGNAETAENGDTQNADTSAVENEPAETEIPDDLPQADLEGYNYVMCINGEAERVAQTWVEELNGEIINDAVYNKLIAVEERFNADITQSELAVEDDNTEAIKKSILAGDDAFDVAQGHDISMAQASMLGMFYNLYDVPHLNFDKPWWPVATTESMTVAGQMYMMFNNISYNNLASTRVMFFNKEMMTDMGLEFPYGQVYEGTWTLDSMQVLVDQGYVDTNGNGVKDLDDKFGYISWDHFYAVMEPFRLEPYQRDADGNLFYSFDLDRMMKLTEKMYALMFGTGGYMNDDVDYNSHDVFTRGNAMFIYTNFSDAITKFSYGDVVYGILPMPKLDEQQDGYYGGSTDRPLAIPITAQAHLDTTGLITEALNAEGYKKVFPAYYETAMKSRYADQTDDAAMMELIHDNVIISFTYLFGEYKSAYNIMFEDLFAKGTPGTDVASWAAKNESAQIAHVEKLQAFFDEHKD